MLRHGLATHNPFQPTMRPWCARCQDEVDVDVDAHHDNTQLLYRETCRRCGAIVSSGVYSNVPLVGATRRWLGLGG
jgi:hypothetical protein